MPRNKKDFLDAKGFTPEQQHGATMRAAAEASKPENMVGEYPYYKVSRSMFADMPCRDCVGTLETHSDTCLKRGK
jgi:hypothetical protein